MASDDYLKEPLSGTPLVGYRGGVTEIGPVHVLPVRVSDPQVMSLIGALTRELADGGYTAAQTFGYSPSQLDRSDVHLVAARVAGELVGVGGVELQEDGIAELKRFYVTPAHRGTGISQAVLAELVNYAGRHGVEVLQLETGSRQWAAIAFYRRQGFVEVPRFGPYLESETSVCMSRTLPPADRPGG